MAHYQALGGAYSFALEPYYELNLTEYLMDPVSSEPGGLFDYEDPYRKKKQSINFILTVWKEKHQNAFIILCRLKDEAYMYRPTCYKMQ